ncbi:hypothetical protein TgHK011_007485 [Trichoderma gracile]|nr:hypothetical protein TgHK011_007485 [Trichoderma gracile]
MPCLASLLLFSRTKTRLFLSPPTPPQQLPVSSIHANAPLPWSTVAGPSAARLSLVTYYPVDASAAAVEGAALSPARINAPRSTPSIIHPNPRSPAHLDLDPLLGLALPGP